MVACSTGRQDFHGRRRPVTSPGKPSPGACPSPMASYMFHICSGVRLAALFALVPFVGTVVIWGPAAIFLASRGEAGYATFLATWGIVVVGMVDNVLRPMLISGRASVPTLAVFVGVMGGLSAFGFIGLFLGPIVLGLLVALFRFETEERDA